MNDGSSVADLVETLRREWERYPTGEKLPSSRALMERHRVSPVTVSRVISALVAEGLVVSRPGAGVFRAERRVPRAIAGDVSWQEVTLGAHDAQAAPRAEASGLLATLTVPPADVVDLGGGYPHPSLLPERALADALARAARRPDAWGRPPVEGLTELRSWFAREIGGPDGSVTAADVLITAGGQAALTAALRALAPAGAPVLVESPTYPGVLGVARAAGLRPFPVPVDGDGLRTDLLADAFAVTGARLLVCQPLFHNPTGATLTPDRRAEVLRLARAAGAFVVEDDYARLLAHADAPALPRPLAADDPDGVVVHVRSLTKAASPSLRIAAVTARGPAFERLRATQVVDSFFVPRPLQEATLALVSSPAWPRHLRALAAALQERRVTLGAALARHLPDLPTARLAPGGYLAWLRLPPGTNESTLAAAAFRAGVEVTPGAPYFAAEPPAPHLRLTHAAAGTATQLAEGVARLASAWPA
ncbi:PLP-dependent aminotransferase family protein [Streptacidiphilus jiangxiensis]|uniref:DNA-binding transcriptional regulator, MocR family, contains an aminotransferase domain n=1 Tax=Streptacidiphilus jiangxiensis TaxID=235985 RepID=A0A1H7USS3_STRJI|nr:PLP-dependent aminotransferase family protein [Streptacidiphilus jiangxiensis]SEL99809.1 DNA-binding transcriptional regulator, MocR family, contains an aminotransferase domain [Streptacidiphilus jiangxiensis]